MRFFKLVPAVAAVAFAAALANGAAAAPAASSAGLCTVARGVAQDIVNSTSIAKGAGLTPAQLKTAYGEIQAAEPALLAAASGAQKTELRQVFSFVNALIPDFEKANWRVAGLAPYMHDLVPRAQRAARPVHALQAYFSKTCKLNV
jgi:hypothetical protein